MTFLLSPGVQTREIDQTAIVPAVATTEGGIVGVFRWGPKNKIILLSSEAELVNIFGKPYQNSNNTWTNVESFFTAANFLSYSDALFTVRVVSSNAAIAEATIFQASYEGELGNSIKVAYTDSSGFSPQLASDQIDIQPSSTTGTINANTNYLEVGDYIIVNNQELRIESITPGSNTNVKFANRYIGTTPLANSSFSYQWGYSNLFEQAPNTNEVHVAVIDEGGEITGISGTVLEVYPNLSLTSGTISFDGSITYIDDVLTNRSKYIRGKSTSSITGKGYERFTGGDDGDDENNIPLGDLQTGYDLFNSSETVDISLFIQGVNRDNNQINYIVDGIAEKRKDLVVFASPSISTPSNYSAQDLVDSVSTINSSSYLVLDSGYKYQYDRYNDLYRYIPMNGDIAGLCARTDDVKDAWFSPAGYQRGGLNNVVRLTLNPNKTDRDLLYKNGINPVITQPGQGTLLFGDKTYLNRPSAFDRINVRRLFLILQKAISRASRPFLFEFNDTFTRSQFVNLVEPFLRDVQGRRGIFDFRVVCDETNNTQEIIDRNEFVADIFVKPARSINFIRLNFIATRTGAEFNEIVT